MYNDISPSGYSSPMLVRTERRQNDTALREIEETLSQVPLIKEVLKRLDKQIALTDSINQAQRLAAKKNISLETALTALSEINERLVEERTYIEARISRAANRKG